MDERAWLDRTIIEVLHTDQIMEHGGSAGVRDEGLLESGLARLVHRWNHDSGADLPTLGAAYGFGIAKNHPFIDGNKRTALMAVYTFLAVNGLELDAPEAEAVGKILGIADSSFSEDELADWIRSRVIPWVE